MITWINTAAVAWSFIMLMACVGLVSSDFETFMSNVIFAAVLGGALALYGYRIYIYVANLKLERDMKKVNLDRERAEIENIRKNIALPHSYRPGVQGVTPTPTPIHPTGSDDDEDKYKSYKVYDNGRVSSLPSGRDAYKRAAILNLHKVGWTPSAIAKEVLGNKGGWQNDYVNKVIEEDSIPYYNGGM